VRQDLLKPFPSYEMASYATNPIVNNVKNNQPECSERVA
jgi:putative SOS response-associated peptidase YedK